MVSACVKTGSKTQATIAQSYAGRELLASVKGGVEALGIVLLGQDIGIYGRRRGYWDHVATWC